MAVGKVGTADNELSATGLVIDELNQLIYIADHDNSRIQVVSFAGNFLKRFGQLILKSPHGIAVTEENVFVTDNTLLLQFRKKDYKLMKRTGTEGLNSGQLNYPNSHDGFFLLRVVNTFFQISELSDLSF